jgi:hypothetical protein
MNDDVAYGLWLLLSLNSFMFIAIALRFANFRPHGIRIRSVHSLHSSSLSRLSPGSIHSESRMRAV